MYGIHKIIIINDTDIAIKLPYIYNNNNNNNNNLNISFKLLNLCGIPLNEINSNYPLDNDRLTGFKNIVNVTTNSFDILSTTKAVNNLTNVGGNNIRIGLISNTIKGYDNSNNYKIEIPIINNVKQISIISSDIPHTQYNINNNNNLLYINFIFNSSNTKSIELLPGYYNTSTLISNIEEKINNIDIIYNLNKNISDNNKDIEFISLESKVSLDSYKDIIKFIIYINLKFINNIFYLSENNNNLLKINHYNHNLDVGDFILISESLSINKIPSNIINQEHQIFKIIDNNNYLIKLPEYIELSNIETNLINIINIKYKLKFRLEFDKKNTFGNLLGFRNIEDKNSITHYHTEISNTTPYINELKLDSNNNINIMQNNRINLNPINYIFLSCNLYYTGGNNQTNVKINNSNYITIAKIYLNNLGKIVYNNHVNLINKFDFIVQKIDNIEFIFHDSNFNLYNFGNMDHSFVIKFDIENILNKDTFINSQTGLSNINTNKQRVFITNK